MKFPFPFSTRADSIARAKFSLRFLRNAYERKTLLSFLAIRIREFKILFMPTYGGGMELFMNVYEAILKRRSIRKYEPGFIIPDEDIKKMLTAAMSAPSACNTRPWEFVVLKSDEAKQKALKIHTAATHLKDAGCAILVCALPDCQKPPATGYFPQDCGAAVENILLTALEFGYGTCWCGIYPREERCEQFRREFNLKSLPIAMVVIGKANEAPDARGFYDEKKVSVI